MTRPLLHLLRLHQMPIYKQLQIEEALLRLDQRNWCIINEGSPPAIVMGISGKPELFLNRSLLQDKPIPLIRRFSGGGTVVVNEQTLFVTFICDKEAVKVSCCPDKIHCWIESLYQHAFPEGFRLRENDYVIGDKKFGGNAQYLRKDRWLHHSSLLWDYNPSHMEYLLLPPKMPAYREKREHKDFLCRLADFHINKEALHENVVEAIQKYFELREERLSDIEPMLSLSHRKATTLVEI